MRVTLRARLIDVGSEGMRVRVVVRPEDVVDEGGDSVGAKGKRRHLHHILLVHLSITVRVGVVVVVGVQEWGISYP